MQVSDYFKEFVAYYVEGVVLDGVCSRQKYLKRYCVLENCDYDNLQENLSILIDALNEYKEKHSKVSLKVAQYQVRFCYLPDNFIESFLSKFLSWEKGSATYSTYMKSRGNDIFDDMPGGKNLKDVKKRGKNVSHEYIDLGLPSGTKWASCNVGATKPEEFGEFYAWGEIEEKTDEYGWKAYSLCDGMQSKCHDVGKSICGTEYDVAYTKWGPGWQMPTLKQFEELTDNCTFEWVTFNGTKGCRFTGPNGNSIFLPAGGSQIGNRLNLHEYGLYWSGTRYSRHEAYSLWFVPSRYDRNDITNRCYGLSIRPVFIIS